MMSSYFLRHLRIRELLLRMASREDLDWHFDVLVLARYCVRLIFHFSIIYRLVLNNIGHFAGSTASI